MCNPIHQIVEVKSGPPALVSTTTRVVVAAAVVLASAASVWLADEVSSSLPPTMARESTAPAPRLASALPTVIIIGRRESLADAPAWVAPVNASELSSLASEDLSSGRVKLR